MVLLFLSFVVFQATFLGNDEILRQFCVQWL